MPFPLPCHSRAEAARLQQALESAETALREAFEASDLLRVPSRPALRRSLKYADCARYPSGTPENDLDEPEELPAQVAPAQLRG